jgi:hypothetical protein
VVAVLSNPDPPTSTTIPSWVNKVITAWVVHKMKGDYIAVDLCPGLLVIQKLIPVIGGVIRGF